MSKPIHERFKNLEDEVIERLEIDGHIVQILKPHPSTPEKRKQTYHDIALILIENEKKKRNSE